jgi:hypothetical protein
MATTEIGGGEFQVTYLAPRKPHPKKSVRYDTAIAAQTTFVNALIKGGSPTYVTPAEKVVEAYATNGGKVLVLIAEKSGYWRTDLWLLLDDGIRTETLTLHKSKRLATSQIMPIFTGLCAAERAT